MTNFRYLETRSICCYSNKRKALLHAQKLRQSGRYKNVVVVPRTLKANRLTRTPKISGYWIKVK